jgi:hypothetical protein
MGFRFRKSINLGGGVKLNVSKKGVGVSAGVKGLRVSVGADGKKRVTASIPGTGISYVETIGDKRKKPLQNNKRTNNFSSELSDEMSKTARDYKDFYEYQEDKFDQGFLNVVSYEINDYPNFDLSGGSKFVKLYIQDKTLFINYDAEYDIIEQTVNPSFSKRFDNVIYKHRKIQSADELLQNLKNKDLKILIFKFNSNGVQYHIWLSGRSHIVNALFNQINVKACFIATEVYGDIDCTEVKKLRKWRDSYLQKYYLGRKFIEFYYNNGEKWCDLIRPYSKVKRMIKMALDSFIFFLK